MAMAEGAEPAALAIFASVHFHIVTSLELPVQQADRLHHILVQHGGTVHAPAGPGAPADLTGLTHIVAATIDFAGYEAAGDRMIAVVDPSWIDTSVAKRRLANPKSHSPDPRMFFSGSVVCTAELPEGDKDAIIGGVLAMGGLYSSGITRLVTHVVALDMQPVACQAVEAKGFTCKIVRPEWFDDCLRLGKRIDEAPYLLPDPEILKNGAGVIGRVACLNLAGALSPEVQVEVPSSEPQSTRDAIFAGKQFLLAGDLALTDHLRDSIGAVVQDAGGLVCDIVEDCDIFIGHYRHGYGYDEAYNAGKTIGNLPWLYWMVAHNRWTSPLKRLLHYPIARDGLPGTGSFRLCLSNYSGEARIYLENLAKAAGCAFTKTLKSDNTHLITAHTQSEKCDAAKEWGIYLVNHLWLEESYARWRIQDPLSPRYTHFPPRTNLTEVVGQTPVDRKALEREFHGQAPTPEAPSTKTKEASSKKAKLSSPPSSPSKILSQRTKFEQLDRERHRETPPTKPTRAGKENETPLTAPKSSRSAKAKATARLHDQGVDMLLFEKELKRKGGVVYGGRRKSYDSESERKRSASEAEMDEEDGVTPSKRAKPATEAPKLRMLVTGVPKYTGQDKPSVRSRDQLRALGILITESEHQCKYLVAPKILRTRKFVCAIAQAPQLVDPSFLDACIIANELLDPADYPLDDCTGEEHYRLTIDGVVRKARQHRGRMLQGWTVWVTREIHGGFEAYKAIVDANGGRCLLFQGRSGSIPAKSSADLSSETEDEEADQTAYLVSGRTQTEQLLWDKFKQQAHAAGRVPRIVTNDWLLDAALKQESTWEPRYQQVGGDVPSE